MSIPKPDPFTSLPLLRSYIVLDMERGVAVRHEVRRDPMTGLTLTRATDEVPQAKPETTP